VIDTVQSFVIDTVQSFSGPGKIYRTRCQHYQSCGGVGEHYFLYRATEKSPWHLSPIKAWLEFDQIIEGIIISLQLNYVLTYVTR